MMNEKSIFLSRASTEFESWTKVLKKGYTLHDESLLEIKAIPFTEIPTTDWIYFYSQNAVKYFKDSIEAQELILYSQKIAAHGIKTAKSFSEAFDKTCSFIFEADNPNSLANFKHTVKNETVLFVQAENSLRTLQNLISELEYSEISVYSNLAKETIDIPPCKYLLFTSPLNVKTYFSNYDYIASQSIICIGEATRQSCLNFAEQNAVYLAEKTLESSMIEKLIELIPEA